MMDDRFRLVTDDPSVSEEDGSLESYCIKLALQLHEMAIELRSANFPLWGGFCDEKYPALIRRKALLLHRGLSYLFENFGSQFVNMNKLFKTLLSGVDSDTLDAYKNKLKEYDSSKKCNVVWQGECVAYRCATCAFNPCMSLCSQCFLNGKHEGHDYTRFFSFSGGACDCGNDDVLDPKGFCYFHGPNRSSVPLPPVELTAPIEFVFAKLFVRLLRTVRKYHNEILDRGGLREETEDTYDGMEIVLLIHHFVNFGGSVIDVVSDILLDKELYARLNSPTELPEDEQLEDLSDQTKLLRSLNENKPLPFPSFPDAEETLAICRTNEVETVELECLLDELIFYLLRLVAPQSLINMLLTLLPNAQYKHRFSVKFFGNYSYIAGLMSEIISTLSETSRSRSIGLSHRIIHISVQICSSINTCQVVEDEISVTDKILNTSIKVFYDHALPSQIDHRSHCFYDTNRSRHECANAIFRVLNTERNKFIRDSGYTFFVTDMQNLLVHSSLATKLLSNLRLCEKYALFISSMQAMNPMWRIVRGNHIEMDNSAASGRAFHVEYDASSLNMFSVIYTIYETPNALLLSNALHCFSNVLKQFFRSAGLLESNGVNLFHCPPFVVTYHLPLHRHLSFALSQAISANSPVYDGVLSEFFVDKMFLQLCVLHPIRIQVVRAEQFAGMWIRNGSALKTSTLYYDHCVYIQGLQNPDLFLIKLGASVINQETFLSILYKSFYLDECVYFYDHEDDLELENIASGVITQSSWCPFMFDGCLRLLTEIFDFNTNNDGRLEMNIREELECLLSFGDLSHSQLKAYIPERGTKFSKRFADSVDSILSEISDYQDPDSHGQIDHGVYKLRSAIWVDEFNPVLCRMRCGASREFSEFLSGFQQRELKHFKAVMGDVVVNEKVPLWLGYRLPNFDGFLGQLQNVWSVLIQPSFFYILYLSLKQAAIRDQGSAIILQQAVYLLTLAAKFTLSERFDDCTERFYRRNSDNRENSRMPKTPLHDVEVYGAENRRDAVFSMFTVVVEPEASKSILSLLLDQFEKSEDTSTQKTAVGRLYNELIYEYMKQDLSMRNRIIGSGKEYIGRLLCYLYKNDFVAKKMIEQRHEMYAEFTKNGPDSMAIKPTREENKAAEPLDNEKRLAAKRRREKLLQAQKQNHARLMKKLMDQEGLTDAELRNADESLTAGDASKRQRTATLYECPICNDCSTCTLSNFIGMMVYAQPNGVLGCARPEEDGDKRIALIPRKEGTNRESLLTNSRSHFYYLRDSALMKIYEGWRGKEPESSETPTYDPLLTHISGSTYVKTCGHTAHLACFKAYMDTMRTTISRSIACPMCRQPVSAILPLKPEFDYEKSRPEFDVIKMDDLSQAASFLKSIISREPIPSYLGVRDANNPLAEYIDGFDEFEYLCRGHAIVHNVAINNDLLEKSSKKDQFLLLGVVRQMIDYQLMQKEIEGYRPSKFGIIRDLLFNARLSEEFRRTSRDVVSLVSRLFVTDDDSGNGFPPILLYEPKSVLCIFCSYILSDHSLFNDDKFRFCKLIYSTLLGFEFFNTALAVFAKTPKEIIHKMVTGEFFRYEYGNTENSVVHKACDFVCGLLKDHIDSILNHMTTSSISFKDQREAGDYFLRCVESVCLDFAQFFALLVGEELVDECTGRAAVKPNILLHHNLATQDSQSSSSVNAESIGHFAKVFQAKTFAVANALLFNNDGEESRSLWFNRCLGDRIHKWISEFEWSAKTFCAQLSSFNYRVVKWQAPKLMRMPQNYDDLFSHFFQHACLRCEQVPTHPFICMICGEFCCLDSCCTIDEENEVEWAIFVAQKKHSKRCCFGNCSFLSLHSSLIVVVRLSQAFIWGSVYLDAYGEEDRNLRRGKPLFLSKRRMQRFERDWLEQKFKGAEDGSRLWLNFENIFTLIRDLHHY